MRSPVSCAVDRDRGQIESRRRSVDVIRVQPWASRTAIIAARMSFQVCGFIITALGNMQPSQQMCRNFLVSLPFSSRSQKPAWWGMSSLPLGSVARQWRPVWSCEPEPKTVASFWATWKSIVQGRRAAVSVLRAASSVALVLPVEVLGQDAVLGGVLAEGVEQRVGHVGLEADGLGLADPLEQVDHRPPGVHAAPADLALGGELLAVVAGDRARPA